MTKRNGHGHGHGDSGKSKKPEGVGPWEHLDPFYTQSHVDYGRASHTASSSSQHSGAAGSSKGQHDHTSRSQPKPGSKPKHNSKKTTILSFFAGNRTYQNVASRVDPSATCAVIRQDILDELGFGGFEKPYRPPYTSVETSDGAVEVRGVIELEWSEVDGSNQEISYGKSNFYTVAGLKKAGVYVPKNFFGQEDKGTTLA